MGAKARVVCGPHSYSFDEDRLKAIPKVRSTASTGATAPAQSADALVTAGDGTGQGSRVQPPRLSGGEGSGESQSYSRESSVGYSTQDSGENPGDGSNKILLRDSIGIHAVDGIRGVAQLGDRGKGVAEVAGDEGAGGDGGVAKRPFQRQVSTGKGAHMLLPTGQGTPRLANSLGGVVPGKEGAESAENKEQTLVYVLSRKDEEIKELKKQLELRALNEGGVAQDLQSQVEEYDEQRNKTTELKRLQSVEEHKKCLQIELSNCKQERDFYKDQVIQLTKQWSLLDQEKGELELNCSRLSAEEEGFGVVMEENERLKEEVSFLNKEAQRKDSNMKKMKDRVKTLTQRVLVGEQGQPSLDSLDTEGVAGSEVMETEDVQKQAASSGGSGFVAEQEAELASLRQELLMKDETIQQLMLQQDKFENMAENLTAMISYREHSSASIKSLAGKCTKLKVGVVYWWAGLI